jgi:hypothetical protein
MPTLNSRGDVIAGGGGLPGSLNAKPYPFVSSGAGCWWDDETINFSYVPAGYRLYAWQPAKDPNGTAITPLAARGFNGIWGGGGVYAALLDRPSPVLYGTYGDIQGAGAASVALDGTLVFKTSYHADRGLTLIKPGTSGQRIALPDADPSWFRALPGGQAIWAGGGAYGREPIKPFYTDMTDVLLVHAAGEDWLQGWVPHLNAVVIQPNGANVGFVFQNWPMFGRSMIGYWDHLYSAFSTTAGETDVITFAATRGGITYLHGSGPRPAFGPLG